MKKNRIVKIMLQLLLLSSTAGAQDTILKHDGSSIIAKISEITQTEIKYKRYGFETGPNYTELKSNINMIVFSNGVKEVFKREPEALKSTANAGGTDDYSRAPLNPNYKIENSRNKFLYKDKRYSEHGIQRLLLNTGDEEIAGYVKKSKQAQALQYIGFAAIPFGMMGLVGMSTANIGSSKVDQNQFIMGEVGIIGAIACPVISIQFKHKHTMYTRKAVALYNEKY